MQSYIKFQLNIFILIPLQRKVRKTESGMTDRWTDRQTDGQTEGKLIVPFGFTGRGLIMGCVMKHICPHTRQIPEVAIIVKTQGQDVKI
jgi:hypothetical protein